MRMMLKQRTGWFAAGHEMAQALLLLSDTAFKLYVYTCLNAARATGRLFISAADLGTNLNRDPDTLRQLAEELVAKCICRFDTADQGCWEIEVVDEFWP